ncbi:hypothetical protein NDU88_010822 [Pleurodeles waltl]|uniref:Uncharacterized protein n=1 Tax=Pleurodeles waltl TaxID=8319 RepID=A0AAV7S4D6_PLEWA|nr:hypothetical protein NDU88_010822 [Pleurodeles waltl]
MARRPAPTAAVLLGAQTTRRALQSTPPPSQTTRGEASPPHPHNTAKSGAKSRRPGPPRRNPVTDGPTREVSSHRPARATRTEPPRSSAPMTMRPWSNPTAVQASGGRHPRPPPTLYSATGNGAARQGPPAKPARPRGGAAFSAAGPTRPLGLSPGSRRRETKPVAHTGTAAETDGGTQVSRVHRASAG